MSAEQYTHIEQDRPSAGGDGELPPSYDDLAAQHGPNSRFGRWRGWIEKRAAERYAEVTPEERQRRKERGWDLQDNGSQSEPLPPPPILYTTSAGPEQHNVPGGASLHIQTANLSLNDVFSTPQSSVSEVPLPFVSQSIPPSHLKINHFGSRFLPHATSPIHCVLPLLADRIVLIGHDDGLSVLDMFPQDWTDGGGISVKRPNEAQAHPVWHGEAVYQMTILEQEDTGEGTPQGVVLALVGPTPDSPSSRDSSIHALRMYNLSSLTSLARWAISTKGARPLDLRGQDQPPHGSGSPSKRLHRPTGSIARSIKSFIESPGAQPEQPTNSYSNLLTATSTIGPSFARGAPLRADSCDSTWDVVEEVPLRWATDYVALASQGSRLSSSSVSSYATFRDPNRTSGSQKLAIITKNSILLYESRRGERAYHFVKDFYTPLQPRGLFFFYQHVQQEAAPRASTDGRHKRSDSGHSIRHAASEPPATINYGLQLCLFVIFDKKASWIRIADSFVDEYDLRDDGGPPNLHASSSVSSASSLRDALSPGLSSITSRTRARLSFEIRESVSAKWILPAQFEIDLFMPDGGVTQKTVICLTKGRRTHLFFSPLPTRLASINPLHVIYWKNAPRSVAARVCRPSRESLGSTAPRHRAQQLVPLVQVVAFGSAGLEVYEIPLPSMLEGLEGGSGKGKSKALSLSALRAEEDLGETGYLHTGGNWDQSDKLYSGIVGLERADSVASTDTYGTYASSVESEDLLRLLKSEVGIYGWCQKGLEDYRLFWVGGTHDGTDEDVSSLYSYS